MVQLDDCPPVTFVKRRNQRSLRIRVKADAIVVSAPLRCSDRQMAGFLREREDWVRKTVQRLSGQRNKRHATLNERRGFTLLHGKWVPMICRPARPGSEDWLLVWREGRVDVYPPENLDVLDMLVPSAKENGAKSGPAPQTHTASLPGDAPPANPLRQTQLTLPLNHEPSVTKLIDVPREIRIGFEKEWARTRLPEEFEQVASSLPFIWTRVFIRSQKTKWGTCSSKGNISLNWRLVKCPEFIRRYIIIHELCHTVHMNHSKAFWSLVEAHFSRVDEAHAWLKKEGELAFL
ncbi:MAG: M48 family metallopeptidase [Balneolales bacterium]|nr:M48 family metallopeptidase [Balneolales bacterium]